jgi:hypothetical protein
MAADGSCLLELASVPKRLQWSPDGQRVLLDSDRIASASGVVSSGFVASNADVDWSAPNGSSLVGATSKGELAKRSAKDAKRTDISFLLRHDESAYHPAGKAIVSIGTDSEEVGLAPVLGIWLADNLGQGRRLLVRDETAAKISEPAFDASGTALYFLADHSSITHVHFYVPSEQTLSQAWQGPGPMSSLTLSPIDDGAWAAVQGTCGLVTPGLVVAFENGAEEELDPVVNLSTRPELRGAAINEPMGWLPDKTLLVLSRPACGQPGTLWTFRPDGSATEIAATKIAEGVSTAAARPTQARIAKDLELPISSQVVA